MTKGNPKKATKRRVVFEDSETESLEIPSVEPKMIEELDDNEEDKVDPIVEEKMKYLRLYARAKGEFRAYLPSWNSPLGQSKEFLQGIIILERILIINVMFRLISYFNHLTEQNFLAQ